MTLVEQLLREAASYEREARESVKLVARELQDGPDDMPHLRSCIIRLAHQAERLARAESLRDFASDVPAETEGHR